MADYIHGWEDTFSDRATTELPGQGLTGMGLFLFYKRDLTFLLYLKGRVL